MLSATLIFSLNALLIYNSVILSKIKIFLLGFLSLILSFNTVASLLIGLIFKLFLIFCANL